MRGRVNAYEAGRRTSLQKKHTHRLSTSSLHSGRLSTPSVRSAGGSSRNVHHHHHHHHHFSESTPMGSVREIGVGDSERDGDPRSSDSQSEGEDEGAEQQQEQQQMLRPGHDPLGSPGERLHKITHAYIEYCAKPADKLVEAPVFVTSILCTILVAGVDVGLRTYPSLENNAVLDAIGWVVLTVFIAEVLLKIVACGAQPLCYFTGPEWRWNWFDFVIVVLSLPFWGSALGGNVAFLRLLRLVRVAKLVHTLPKLRMILLGLFGGLQSIVYIFILLFLVFYLYAIAGILFFRDNDPWHFQSVPRALITLFRAATLEDWTDIMYINIFGCDAYTSIYVDRNQETPDNSQYWCEASRSQPALSAAYWLSFIVVSSMVMLSLFIGAVTMAMAESMTAMQEEAEALKKQRLREKQLAKMQLADTVTDQIVAKRKSIEAEGGIVHLRQRHTRESINMRISIRETLVEDFNRARDNMMETLGLRETEEEKDEQKKRVTNLLLKVWNGTQLTDITEPGGPKKRPRPTTAVGKMGHYYLRVAYHCNVVVSDNRFVAVVTFVILAAGVLVGLQTDRKLNREHGDVLMLLDTIILYIFVLEFLLKLVAQGKYPLRVFLSGWNTFDFVVIVGSFSLGGGTITMLRLLRLLRVLKLVRSLKQLQVIVEALINGFSSIGYLAIVLFLVFYVFAIVGIILFRDNDPWHFGTLHMAMITLFRCATLEDWSDVMYINMLGCDKYGYEQWPEKCKDPQRQMLLASIYFVIFIVIGALVLLSLFVGVITMSMTEAQQRQWNEEDVERRVKIMMKTGAVCQDDVDTFQQVFELLDLDQGGSISAEELQLGLEAVGTEATDEEVQLIMDSVDEDGSGDLDFAEFLQINLLMRMLDEQEGASRMQRLDSLQSMSDLLTGRAPSVGNLSPVVAQQRALHGSGRESTHRQQQSKQEYRGPGGRRPTVKEAAMYAAAVARQMDEDADSIAASAKQMDGGDSSTAPARLTGNGKSAAVPVEQTDYEESVTAADSADVPPRIEENSSMIAQQGTADNTEVAELDEFDEHMGDAFVFSDHDIGTTPDDEGGGGFPNH